MQALKLFLLAGALLYTMPNPALAAYTKAEADPYLWLEEVTSEKALDWARAQNVESTRELQARQEFSPIRERLLKILDSREKIPFVSKHGKHYYNFWRDEQHVRGLWRRTTLEEYKKAQPAWETVLDIDALAESEKENWVWKGSDIFYPDYDRALISLSRGGADAVVIREFDLNTLQFIQDGFSLPEAKSRVDWKDKNTLYVGTDFGPGSLTSSGYPRLVKRWSRGTPLTSSTLVFEGKPDDMVAQAYVAHDQGRLYEFLQRRPGFYTSEEQILRGDRWVNVPKPDDAEISTFHDHALLELRSDWTIGGKTYTRGSLLALSWADLLAGKTHFTVLFRPTERSSLSSKTATRDYLVLNVLENVRNKLYACRLQDGKWSTKPLASPGSGTVSVSGIDPDESNDYFATSADFLNPTTLYLGTIGRPAPQPLKSLPKYFDASGLVIRQHQATSRDGTRIPYFLVSKQKLKSNGQNPTLLYGYGGFEISLLPSYNAGMGAAWLERGGVYVLANIRGGGEFGPRWHHAALKENRQRAYDDFIAVADDIVKRKITSPERLGIQGGSNGGLLMGAMLTQRPDLFKAVVCQVPLLDMQRYHKLLAGASWMAEYGNPDLPDEWAYISKYSPYQNVKPGVKYPRTLFMTSTRDDRVHPGHARKMVARMKEQGHDVLYYENIEGGHGGAANNQQAAFMSALAYTFLIHELALR